MLELGAENARRRLPELLERAHNGEQAIITKRGVPYAAIVPTDQRPEPAGETLLDLMGTGKGLWGDELGAWVDKLRDEWA